jgi:hypothetical protein
MQLRISPSMRSITISSSNGVVDSMKVRVAPQPPPPPPPPHGPGHRGGGGGWGAGWYWRAVAFPAVVALGCLLPFAFILGWYEFEIQGIRSRRSHLLDALSVSVRSTHRTFRSTTLRQLKLEVEASSSSSPIYTTKAPSPGPWPATSKAAASSGGGEPVGRLRIPRQGGPVRRIHLLLVL